MVLKIHRRSDQQVSTLQLDKFENYKISNDLLITARVNDGLIHLNIWAEGNTNKDPKNFVITPAEAPQYGWDCQINQNVALVKYESIVSNNHYELWNLSHPSVQLKLPDCVPLLTEYENQMEGLGSSNSLVRWLLDTNANSEYLVGLFSEDRIALFVFVFDGFTSPKYTNRITIPENVRDHCINMGIFGSGKNAKTVLTMQNTSHFFVFDVSNGQRLLTISLDRLHSSSGYYLFPGGELTDEDHSLGGVNVIRIECNGKNWTTCTTFVSYGHVEGFGNMISLIAVTDTQTLWKVDMDDGSAYCIMCDYLLNELH